MPYCLKAVKKTNEIDLKSILEPKFYEKIKLVSNIEAHNALLILVAFENAE
jgi:hypothetical protein